jgi:toxin HigB-1
MIKTFRCKHTEKVFLREPTSKFSQDIGRKALRKLLILDAAERLDDLRVPPGNQLEKLSEDRQGQYSVRVNEQWRICFRCEDGDAFEIEIVDYH